MLCCCVFSDCKSKMPLDLLAHLVKEVLPCRLRSIPLPESASSFNYFTLGEWIQFLGFVSACGTIVYALKVHSSSSGVANVRDKIGEPFVFNNKNNLVIDIRDLEYGTKFCRCLRSKKFPFCDGTHNALNNGSGKLIYPLKVSKRLDYPFFPCEKEEEIQEKNNMEYIE